MVCFFFMVLFIFILILRIIFGNGDLMFDLFVEVVVGFIIVVGVGVGLVDIG